MGKPTGLVRKICAQATFHEHQAYYDTIGLPWWPWAHILSTLGLWCVFTYSSNLAGKSGIGLLYVS